MSWLEKAHERTGIPKEDLERMSWPEIEQSLGIEIVEPPYEIKQRTKGYFARHFRWMTKEEVEKAREDADKIFKKYNL